MVGRASESVTDAPLFSYAVPICRYKSTKILQLATIWKYWLCLTHYTICKFRYQLIANRSAHPRKQSKTMKGWRKFRVKPVQCLLPPHQQPAELLIPARIQLNELQCLYRNELDKHLKPIIVEHSAAEKEKKKKIEEKCTIYTILICSVKAILAYEIT